jgi:hypothetical protein
MDTCHMPNTTHTPTATPHPTNLRDRAAATPLPRTPPPLRVVKAASKRQAASASNPIEATPVMCQTVVSYCLSSMAGHKYPSIIFNNAMRARMYVRTYVCTYVYTHACTNARTHVRTHTRAHAHTHICTHAITHTYTHAHTHLANTESLCCVAEGAISRCRVRRSS